MFCWFVGCFCVAFGWRCVCLRMLWGLIACVLWFSGCLFGLGLVVLSGLYGLVVLCLDLSFGVFGFRVFWGVLTVVVLLAFLIYLFVGIAG